VNGVMNLRVTCLGSKGLHGRIRLKWILVQCGCERNGVGLLSLLTAEPRNFLRINLRFQSVPHRKHYVTATEPSRLLLFGEAIAVCCENRTEHIITLRGQNATADGTCS
jgi:hypothetical protein